MGYFRFRFSNIRFKLFVLGFALLYIYILKNIFYVHLYFYNEFQVSDCLVFLCLTDKEHVTPRLSLTNVAMLNYLLRSQIFVNDDGQL